jgi:hypothetical protein
MNLKIENSRGESIELGQMKPFFVELFDEDTAVQIRSTKAPFQDGSSYEGSSFDERTISIEGRIMDNDLMACRRTMQRVINPKFCPLKLSYEENGEVREIQATTESIPKFLSGQGNKGVGYQKYLIQLICHEPFWINAIEESEEMSYIMGGLKFKLCLPGRFSSRGFKKKCENKGDVETPVIITFKGPATTPVVKNLTTGEFIKLNKSLEADDVLSISTAFGNKYVRINGENAFHYIDLTTTFWSLVPGENILSYESNDDSVKTKVAIKWKDKFTGI